MDITYIIWLCQYLTFIKIHLDIWPSIDQQMHIHLHVLKYTVCKEIFAPDFMFAPFALIVGKFKTGQIQMC